MSSSVIYQVIDSSRYEETLSFYYDNYAVDEPLIKAAHESVAPAGRNAAIDKFMLFSMQSDLSWCAIDEESGKIVGIRISYGIDVNDPDHERTYEDCIAMGMTPQLANVFVFLGTTLNHSFNTKQILMEQKKTKQVFMLVLSVDSDYSKMGIATEL